MGYERRFTIHVLSAFSDDFGEHSFLSADDETSRQKCN
jgi:hypothetical protein